MSAENEPKPRARFGFLFFLFMRKERSKEKRYRKSRKTCLTHKRCPNSGHRLRFTKELLYTASRIKTPAANRAHGIWARFVPNADLLPVSLQLSSFGSFLLSLERRKEQSIKQINKQKQKHAKACFCFMIHFAFTLPLPCRRRG